MTQKSIFLISILLTLFGCGQKSNTEVDNSNLTKQFTSDWHKYSIKYTHDWTVKKMPDDNNVFFIDPKIDSGLMLSNVAFGIEVFSLPEIFTSQYTYETNMNSFRSDSTFKNFKIKSSDQMTIATHDAIKVIHSSNVFGTETISLQYYLAIEKKLYIMGGSLPINSLGKYEGIFDEMVNSMEFN